MKSPMVRRVLAIVAVAHSAFAAPESLAEEPSHPAVQRAADFRFGDKSLENIVRTDERYGHDGLFQGPRGWCYWNFLNAPKPIQNPNLWPDMQSTYFIGRLTLPAGSSMLLRGEFPHARFFQVALYKWERNTFVAIGESLRGPNIEPDDGSTNPYRVGANRLAEDRSYTIRVLAEEAPKEQVKRAENTLYVGCDEAEIEAVIRIYLPDQGYDGSGWGLAHTPFAGRGLPTYEATLADGTKLTSEQVIQQFSKPISGGTEQPLNTQQWIELVRSKDNDPNVSEEAAPAHNPPQWEKFWTIAYSVTGVFKAPEDRAKLRWAGAMEGGGEGPYLVTYLSRKYGPVYVLKGKMPTFPNTYSGGDGKGLATMPDAQTQYWSLVSCEAVPSGQVVDGICDFQVPLDEDRNYTIVVSRREDRPRNATMESGVAWVEWSPRGEGLADLLNRADFGMLIMRLMANNPNWEERPDNILEPGTAAEVMGQYFPRGKYTTKEDFEAQSQNMLMTTGQGKTMPLTMQTLTDSREYQYCEIVFNYGDNGNDIYSTSPLARVDLEWWNSLDLEALAKEFGAESVYKNGPQWWSMDEVGVMASEPVKVAGVQMVFGGHLPPGTLAIPKYKVFNPAKFQNLTWKAGKPLYQLVDADGHMYILQGHKIPVEELATLGQKFEKLPDGWEYRVKVLDEDLVMKLTPREPIPSVQDEFNQIYIRIPE